MAERGESPGSLQKYKDGTPSVVAAVLGEATFSRLCKSGIHLFGCRYEVEAYEEARPDAFCNRFSRWGHIAPHCSADPRRSICAGTTPRKIAGAPSRGAGRDGAADVHMRLSNAPTARALMGRGPRHAPPRRRPANSRGGGSPPPRPRRERRGTSPKLPEDETLVAPEGGEEGKTEVEERIEPSAEEMEE